MFFFSWTTLEEIVFENPEKSREIELPNSDYISCNTISQYEIHEGQKLFIL